DAWVAARSAAGERSAQRWACRSISSGRPSGTIAVLLRVYSAQRRRVEGAAEDPFRRPNPVEVGCSAAHLERPASAKKQAQVDVFSGRNYAIVEHALDLVGKAILDAPQQLLGRH